MMAWRPRHWCFSSRRKPRCERRRKAGVPAGLRPGRLGPPRLALPVPAPPGAKPMNVCGISSACAAVTVVVVFGVMTDRSMRASTRVQSMSGTH
jgi:hypothetical protein